LRSTIVMLRGALPVVWSGAVVRLQSELCVGGRGVRVWIGPTQCHLRLPLGTHVAGATSATASVRCDVDGFFLPSQCALFQLRTRCHFPASASLAHIHLISHLALVREKKHT
jgi:hypothetical protein